VRKRAGIAKAIKVFRKTSAHTLDRHRVYRAYWTGRGFTKDRRKALAYADENVIARDMRRILKRRCKELIRYRFVAPVMIDVYAEGPIDQGEITWFLSQKCFISKDGLGTGVGPGESVVLPMVDWESLRMLKGGSERKQD